eukprot:TRINITY_DN6957_c0_g2_i1.p1 TRINITY_DN6957_c0_g2~~TRINITY_DN6957_c0_g2_i1.p1  ORF type:complete len:538 (-),score=85.75 TRINITY_DN6957_c0_g2_i1:31-1644(-)
MMEQSILAFATLTREELHRGLDPRTDEVFFHFPPRFTQLYHHTPHGIRLSNLIRMMPEKAIAYIEDSFDSRRAHRHLVEGTHKLSYLYGWTKLLDATVEWAQSLQNISMIVYRTESFVSALLDAICKVTSFAIDRVESLQNSPYNADVSMSYHIMSSCFGFINSYFTTKSCKRSSDILVARLNQKDRGFEFTSALFDGTHFFFQEYSNPREDAKKSSKKKESQKDDGRDQALEEEDASSSDSEKTDEILIFTVSQRVELLHHATVLLDTIYYLCSPQLIKIILDHSCFQSGTLLQLYLEFLKIRPLSGVLDASLLRAIFSTLDCEEPCSLDMIAASENKDYCIKVLDILLLRFSGYVSTWEWDDRSVAVCSLIDMFSNDSNFKSYVIANGYLPTLQLLSVDLDVFDEFLDKYTDTATYIFRLLGNLHCHNPDFSNSEEDAMLWKTIDCIDGRNGIILSRDSIENIILNLRFLIKCQKLTSRKNIASSDVELVQQFLEKLFDHLVIMKVIEIEDAKPDKMIEKDSASQSAAPPKRQRY